MPGRRIALIAIRRIKGGKAEPSDRRRRRRGGRAAFSRSESDETSDRALHSGACGRPALRRPAPAFAGAKRSFR